MYIPKKYGASKKIDCVFCGKSATGLNKQKLPCCVSHKDDLLEDVRCNCGSYLEIKEGKFGTFFLCMKCGPINMNRALNMIKIIPKNKKTENRNIEKKEIKNSVKKEIIIDTDNTEYFS